MTDARTKRCLKVCPSTCQSSNAMKRIISFLLPALIAASVLRADPSPDQRVPDQLDLKTAIRFALENNFQIREARERIKQQTGVVVQVRAQEIPTVTASGSYQINQDKISQTEPATGNFWQVSLIASETVYAGGGVQASISNAKLNEDAATLDLQSVINQALLDVRTKFYTVLLDREKVGVQEQNIKLLQDQLKDATNRFDAGATSNFDKLQATVALANGQVPLISARNDLRIAVDQLRQSLGFTNNAREDVRKNPEFLGTLDQEATSFDLQSALDSARSDRPELKRFQKLRDAGSEGLKIARSTYLPNVGLAGGFEAEKNPFQEPGTSDNVSGWYVGLKGQWNLFDGGATHGKVLQARSVLEQAKLVLAEQTLAVDVQVRQAYSTWQEALELITATKQTVGQAEESLRLATARYGAGSCNPFRRSSG